MNSHATKTHYRHCKEEQQQHDKDTLQELQRRAAGMCDEAT